MAEYIVNVCLMGNTEVKVEADTPEEARRIAEETAEIGDVSSWSPSADNPEVAPRFEKFYQTVVTIQSPFGEPTDIPYCLPTTDRCTALAALTSAFDLHSRSDDHWTLFVGVRIDVTNREIPA